MTMDIDVWYVVVNENNLFLHEVLVKKENSKVKYWKTVESFYDILTSQLLFWTIKLLDKK